MAKHTGIRKLQNGHFRARYFRGYDAKTGRRVYPARTFDTEREAREWRAGEVVSRGSNIVEGRGILLSAYLDHWLSTKPDLRENSRHTYEVYINSCVKPQLGQIKLSRLSPSDIERWQADLLERRELSATTISHVRNMLHQALKSAFRKNLVRSNAVENTDGPKTSRSQRYPLTVEEALTIMAECESAENGLAYQLIAHCGLRPEEVLGLKWADLELSNGARGVIRVNQVVHHVHGEKTWRFHRPKTESSERVVKFPSDLVARLIEHRRKQREQKLRTGQVWRNNDLVFTDDVGDPLKRPALAYRFVKLIKRLGLPKEITMYALRHFFVTSSLMAGVDFKTVSREAGHSNVAFTLQVYGSVLDEMHDDAADKRERLLKNRGKR